MTDIDKDKIPTKLLWVDLEMTGLDAQQDVILEIAAEITDFDFKTLESYEARISHPQETVVKRMQANIWWKDYPQNRDEFVQKLAEGKPLQQVEQELVAIIQKHFGNDPAILAGNSIHSDRGFIKQWMPALDLKLHYRMLDVTSFKIVMQGKYGEVFEKPEVHRAFDDIQASIAELQHYLDWFKTDGSQDS
ncbi:MAG: oligoribonuclease [Patescibacteria group bacterium]|nr:oligoribonuclease [Patescibacteria group bacterium]